MLMTVAKYGVKDHFSSVSKLGQPSPLAQNYNRSFNNNRQRMMTPVMM